MLVSYHYGYFVQCWISVTDGGNQTYTVWNAEDRQVSTSQDDVAQNIVKERKVDQGYTFQKKGHKQQFWFYADIDEHI